jgi:hypothetical protein
MSHVFPEPLTEVKNKLIWKSFRDPLRERGWRGRCLEFSEWDYPKEYVFRKKPSPLQSHPNICHRFF